MMASNDIVVSISVRSTASRCLINRLVLHIRYDFVNEIVRRVVLEVWISPEITVNEMFGSVGIIIKKFNGDFELTRDHVKVYFNIRSGNLESVIAIIDLLKDLLCRDLSLVVDGYSIPVNY